MSVYVLFCDFLVDTNDIKPIKRMFTVGHPLYWFYIISILAVFTIRKVFRTFLILMSLVLKFCHYPPVRLFVCKPSVSEKQTQAPPY